MGGHHWRNLFLHAPYCTDDFCVSTQLSAISDLIVSTWHRAGTGTFDRWPALDLRALHARSRPGLFGRALLARPNDLRKNFEKHSANTVHVFNRAKKEKINPSDDFWRWERERVLHSENF